MTVEGTWQPVHSVRDVFLFSLCARSPERGAASLKALEGCRKGLLRVLPQGSCLVEHSDSSMTGLPPNLLRPEALRECARLGDRDGGCSVQLLANLFYETAVSLLCASLALLVSRAGHSVVSLLELGVKDLTS